MQIDINDQTNALTTKQLALLNEVLRFTAEKEQIAKQVELSVSIVSNETIQKMNYTYRQKNEPTDVLSFQMDHPFDALQQEAGLPIMMGDIIISIDKVNEQKERYNHSFERELIFLAVHGFLHLIGYTHDNKANEKNMFQKQDAILEAYRLER